MNTEWYRSWARRGAYMRIQELNEELEELHTFLKTPPDANGDRPKSSPPKRSKLSAAGRAAISRAMKARWKKYRASQR